MESIMESVYYTAAQLAARGGGDIPKELNSSTHLIYSSPATLAFNSPGAEGYGAAVCAAAWRKRENAPGWS